MDTAHYDMLRHFADSWGLALMVLQGLKASGVQLARLVLKGLRVRMVAMASVTQLTAVQLHPCTAGLFLSISARLHRFTAAFFWISEGLPNGNSTSASARLGIKLDLGKSNSP